MDTDKHRFGSKDVTRGDRKEHEWDANSSANDGYRQVRTRIDTSDSFSGMNRVAQQRIKATKSGTGFAVLVAWFLGCEIHPDRNRRKSLNFHLCAGFCRFISHRKSMIFRNLSHLVPLNSPYFIGYFTSKCLIFRALRKNRGDFFKCRMTNDEGLIRNREHGPSPVGNWGLEIGNDQTFVADCSRLWQIVAGKIFHRDPAK